MQDWLAHRSRATPDREALVNAGSGNAWSYATLDETVEEMAGRLRALDVAADDHLAAVLGTGVEEVCLFHAAMRLGTTLVPLSPEFTAPELRERFERADVETVVCGADTEDAVRGAAESVGTELSVLSIDETEWRDATPISAAEPTEFTAAEWERTDVQLLMFTSGTTGRAKVVQLTMGNLLASAVASAFRLGIDPEDRWLVPLSLHHMGGIAPVLRSTLYGTTAIVEASFDAGGTVDDIRSFDATCVSLVPTMLRRMLDARGTLPDSLRFVLVGGAPCPDALIDRCRDFSVPVCPTYGMTETGSQIATARHREAYEIPGSVGPPLQWTDVTVVDETGDTVEPGETGELVVSGPTVTPGYYGEQTATAEAFGTHGLHTGDVGYQDENGRLYVLNRLDDRILTGGENVDPGEVVDALRDQSGVVDAAVVGLPDDEWGERVGALLVPEGEAVDVNELEQFLRERLAGFKLPRTVGVTDALPRTVSGTVERDAVREELLAGETVEIGQSETSGREGQGTGGDGAAPDAEAESTAERHETSAATAETPAAADGAELTAPDSESPGGAEGNAADEDEGLSALVGRSDAERSAAAESRKGGSVLSGSASADSDSVVDEGVEAERGAALGSGRGGSDENDDKSAEDV
jgi:O-succinylbenzoic acid--CoA ligase